MTDQAGQSSIAGPNDASRPVKTDRQDRPRIHASNAWNPTGLDLWPVPECRLYYAHVLTLGGERTQVFLGSQQHLTFVAELAGHLPVAELRDAVLTSARLYPHLLGEGSSQAPTQEGLS